MTTGIETTAIKKASKRNMRPKRNAKVGSEVCIEWLYSYLPRIQDIPDVQQVLNRSVIESLI